VKDDPAPARENPFAAPADEPAVAPSTAAEPAEPPAEPLAEKPASPPPADEEVDPAKVAAQVRRREAKAGRAKEPVRVATPPVIGDYKLPHVRLLSRPEVRVRQTESKEELLRNAHIIRQTLAQFGIEVAQGDITKGPVITRYELHPAPGVKLEKIVSLTNNIAAALRAERIHVLAPVPGKSSVGIEVPNAVKSKVILRELLESDAWIKSRAKIPLALGKNVDGQPIVADLADMPHLLIAGATGSGKSVCINSIVASLLYRFSPEDLRFVMIDPKVVELQQYNALPHLVVPVVTDPKKVILALRWVVNEMEKRYQIFAKVGVRNIHAFNKRPKTEPPKPAQPELPLSQHRDGEPAEGFAVELDEAITVPREEDIVIPDKLSYIVVIIDELADLMLVAPADVEMAIARITQMARAAGIHCIVATQRPSVDVITGVIKANIPARIAFQVASKVDSRTILDAMGAEKLLGKGDMLFLPPGSAKLIRAQGAFVTDEEIERLVQFIAQQGRPSYEMEIHQQLSKAEVELPDERSSEDEELLEKCIEVIRSEQKASVSLLQRRLRIGYTRAARLMDELEARGIVGPSKGAEPRDILIDLDAVPDQSE
ncbi:MAG: DNA translocase FtsK, partial [Verrucomicrobia bacterium]